MDNRFSCRGFLKKEVEQKFIEQIVQVAQKVPSWCNSQPWEVTLLRPETRRLLSEKLSLSSDQAFETPDIDFPKRYAGVYKTRRSICGWQLYNAVGVEKGDRKGASQQMAKNYEFFGAPRCYNNNTKRPRSLWSFRLWSFHHCLYFGSCCTWVSSIPQAAIAGRAPIVREVLNIGEDRDVLCAISFGFADTDHPANSFRTERADLAEFVEWV